MTFEFKKKKTAPYRKRETVSVLVEQPIFEHRINTTPIYTEEEKWFSYEAQTEIKSDLKLILEEEKKYDAIVMLQAIRDAYDKEALKTAAKNFSQSDKQKIYQLIAEANIFTTKAETLIQQLEKVQFDEEYYDLVNPIYATGEDGETLLIFAWGKTQQYIRKRINALLDGTIKQVKFFKFTAPDWCPFIAGEIIQYKDSKYWFSSIPKLGGPKYSELTPSQQKEDGVNWISLTPINGKYEINAKVKDCERW
jgi:hypothetical protein